MGSCIGALCSNSCVDGFSSRLICYTNVLQLSGIGHDWLGLVYWHYSSDVHDCTDIRNWWASRRLQLNKSKTELAFFGKRSLLNKIAKKYCRSVSVSSNQRLVFVATSPDCYLRNRSVAEAALSHRKRQSCVLIYAGPIAWNALPASLHNITDWKRFRKQ